MLIRKLILINFFLIIFFAIPVSDQDNFANAQYDVQLGTVKVTNNSIFWFGVYEGDRPDELIFLTTNQLVEVEKIQIQFYSLNSSSDNDQIKVTVKDYEFYNSTSNEFIDLIETEYTVFMSQGFGYTDIEFEATAEERKIIISVLDTRFVFYHKSQKKELPFLENITLGEYQERLMGFGLISVIVSVISLIVGYTIDKKAKGIPIPKELQSVLFVAFGLIIGLGATLTVFLGDLFINEILYFSAIAISTCVIGILRNEIEFKQYLGFIRSYKRGKEFVKLVSVKVYYHNNALCVANNGFLESLRRLFNNHVLFMCDYNHSIIINNYDKGFELEWSGYRKSRVLEWVTVGSHKLPSRMVSDLNQRIAFYEIALRELENDFNDAKSNYEVEFHRRMSMNFEAHYSKLGVNLHQLNAVDDETYQLAADLTGKTVKEIKEEIKKEEDQIKDTSSPLPSRVSKILRSFRR